MSDQYTIVANFNDEGRGIAKGALVYVHAATAFGNSLKIIVKSRGGRWITTWVARKKLENYRRKTFCKPDFKYPVILMDDSAQADEIVEALREDAR